MDQIFPVEIWHNILQYCQSELDLCRLAQTSSTMQNIVDSMYAYKNGWLIDHLKKLGI